MTNFSLKHLRGLLGGGLCIMLLVFAFSCSKPGSELVGTWDNAKVPEVVEFKPDGTGTFYYPNNLNPPLNFVWKKTAENSYSLEVTYMGSNRILTGTLKDKTLSLTSNVGIEIYNKRATR